MRGAWFLAMPVVLGGVWSLGAANAAEIPPRADTSTSSVYITGLPAAGADTAGRLLPIQGVDLPVVTAIGAKTASGQSPSLAPVEAIPTPTAFQAGGLVLATIGLSRWLRKLARA